MKIKCKRQWTRIGIVGDFKGGTLHWCRCCGCLKKTFPVGWPGKRKKAQYRTPEAMKTKKK